MNCPHCKGPMVPMISSWFCPKDCDRPTKNPGNDTITDRDGIVWFAERVLAGQEVPVHAMRGWNLQSWDSGVPNYTSAMPLGEVLVAVGASDSWRDNRPWLMYDRITGTGQVFRGMVDILALWEKK